MLKKIMDKGEKFRNDSEIIDMYEHDLTLEEIHEYEIEEAVLEATEKVTFNTTRNIAINMLNLNMNLEDISKATGLSIDELNELKKELD